MLDVTVNIKLAEVVGKVGTWFPCLYVVDEALEGDKYDEYSKLSELTDKTYGKTVYEEDSNVYAAASKLFMQDNAPHKIAVLAQPAFSAATIATHATKNWRQLILVGEHDNVAAIAEYIESAPYKMLFARVSSTDELTTLETSVKEYDRTVLVYHTTDATAAAAVVGATAGLVAGSFTYKNMAVKGVEAMDLSATEIANIHSKGAITIVEKVGDIVTSEGIVASGEYADDVDSKDYVVQNIAYNTQKVLNNNDKVPYTNQGISLLETATIAALKDAYNNGMIADNEDGAPGYSASFAMRSQTTAADRAARNYPYGIFEFILAGAIHNVTVNGTVAV